MQNDPDKELFSKLSEIKDFAEVALRNDTLEDWNLAKQFGEFMIRMAPEDILGHALVARACRHLGDSTRALGEINRCRTLFADGDLTTMEREVFGPFLEKELRISSG
jgi:hypothetical protein